MPKYHLSINKNGTLIERYGVSTYLIEYFNLKVNQQVPCDLFKQIECANHQGEASLSFQDQTFPISIEPSEDLYQITFLSNRDMKVA